MHKSRQQLCLDAPVHPASSVLQKAASVFCMSDVTRSRSVTVMGPNPAGLIVLYGQHEGRMEGTGNTLESDVDFL